MRFIDNQGITDPRINLAIEEYVLRHLSADHDYLLFYINEPSIIIGKNQNTLEELNEKYVSERGIHVVRRLSGGGAVYHDLGNLNFSFITNDDGRSFQQFEKFTAPVIKALHDMGVQAESAGRNDIVVEGRKISGNAQFAVKGRMFSHGTLLFDSDVDSIVSALRVNEHKIQSKGIRSIRSRVANISEFLNEPLTIEQFKDKLLLSIFGGEEIPQYILSEQDWEEIQKISAERYGNWDWNYGKSPAYDFRQNKRLSTGTFDVRLKIEGGKIKNAKIYGDFFSLGDVSELEQALIGVRHDRESIQKLLQSFDLNYYTGVTEPEEWIEMFMP